MMNHKLEMAAAWKRNLKWVKAMLQSGLMWFDNTKNVPLADKARVAIARARQRLGAVNVCYVNSAHVEGDLEVDGLPVIGVGCIPPGYLWVGWENERGQVLPSQAVQVDAEQLSFLRGN